MIYLILLVPCLFGISCIAMGVRSLYAAVTDKEVRAANIENFFENALTGSVALGVGLAGLCYYIDSPKSYVFGIVLIFITIPCFLSALYRLVTWIDARNFKALADIKDQGMGLTLGGLIFSLLSLLIFTIR